MFYLAEVPETGDVMDRGLDAQDQSELVVQLQGYRSQGGFDARARNADVEAVPHLVLELRNQFLAQKLG
jgi:hypothetical protein